MLRSSSTSHISSTSIDRRQFFAGVAAAAFISSDRLLAQPSGLTDLSIAQASRLIRSRDLSPVDLVRAYLERIGRFDDSVNAYITVTGERALSRAEELERELANGRWRGPLHGIPIALKDNIDTAGVLTTAASAVFADRTPAEDAEVVVRLEEAGAITLGKLNMHEFAYLTGGHTHFGQVHNPWDLDKVTGGSSSGSGAAVAARLCAGALGTDTAGSVRLPAAYCGIVGLKQTYGLASMRGIVPLSISQDTVGPMCRTVADTALMLQAIVGYDPNDVSSIEAVVPDYSSAMLRRVSTLRLGIPRAFFYEDVDTEILDAVERALDLLSEWTATVRDVELPPWPQTTPSYIEAYKYHSDFLGEKRDLYGAGTLDRILRGANVSATEYVDLLTELILCRKAIASVFDDVDLLITPTTALLPIGIDDALRAPSEAGGMMIRNTAPFNRFGIPTITVPCGFSRGGLPIGLQISGRALGELDVLALAHAYEQATDWHEREPPLA